jgi:glutathione S-transferase
LTIETSHILWHRTIQNREASMFKVYGRANSINVRKVLWMLDEVGQPSTRADWGRGYRPTNEPEFLRVSNFGVVPVIDDDGFILRESQTIVRYLAAKHARADLYPTDLKTRAQIEAWMDWAATDLYWAARPVFHAMIVNAKDPATAIAPADGVATWTGQMQRLEQQLAAKGPFLMGDRFTIADIPAGMVVNRWFSLNFAKPKLPTVTAYYDRLTERPPFRTHGRNGTP